MVVDFCLPEPGQSLLDALQMWDNKATKRLLRLLVPHGDHLVGRAGVQRDEAQVVRDKGITSFKHFMAYKGALMVE
jgi:dihydropyrimidinase